MATDSSTPIPVPSLSTQGLVYDAANKFDLIMAHVFASDTNQSYLYPGKISSLAAWIEIGSGDRLKSQETLKNGFYAYLNRYYQEVNVDVSITEIDMSTSRLDFKVSITVTEAGQQQDYSALIKTVKKQLEEIIKLNNYGE